MWSMNVCVCSSVFADNCGTAEHPHIQWGSELLDTGERLSEEKSSTEIPYSQACSVFVQGKEILSYPLNQTACKCQATVISLVTETRNFSFKLIISIGRYSRTVAQSSCTFLQKGTKENTKPFFGVLEQMLSASNTRIPREKSNLL